MRNHAALLLVLVSLAACGHTPEPAITNGAAASADGVMIHYDVRGSGDSAIVLVHGWTNSRGIWGKHPETLSRTHRVVALDLAGHGVSGTDRRDWTVDAFGEDVVAVVDQLALERVVLVGFSMGGLVVLEAAERLGEDRVMGIVFIDTIKNPERRMSDAQAAKMAAAFRANWGNKEFVRAFGFKPDAPESLVDELIEKMPEQPRELWFAVLDSVHEWMTTELEPTLQRVEVPLAAINTPVPPTNVEALRRYSPSFTVDTIEGVGHAGILLRRVEEFDARLLAIVERFASANSESEVER